jgi:hypothetical protein
MGSGAIDCAAFAFAHRHRRGRLVGFGRGPLQSDVHNARFDAAHTDAKIRELLTYRKRAPASTLSNRIR